MIAMVTLKKKRSTKLRFFFTYSTLVCNLASRDHCVVRRSGCEVEIATIVLNAVAATTIPKEGWRSELRKQVRVGGVSGIAWTRRLAAAAGVADLGDDDRTVDLS